MDCTEIRERLEACALEETVPPERGEIEAHLEECPACREELEELETVVEACRRVLRHPLPLDRFEELQRRMHPARHSATPEHLALAWRRRLVRRGLAVAAALFIGLWLGPRPEEMARPPEGLAQLLRAVATPDGTLMDKVSADASPMILRQAMIERYLDWTPGQEAPEEALVPGSQTAEAGPSMPEGTANAVESPHARIWT